LVVLALILATHSGECQETTLERLHDPIVLKTAALGPLPDPHTAAWRLYRLQAGEPVPIPFQFDPVDAHGDVDVDAPQEFELDANDQLVFMARDVGDRAPDGWRLPGGDALLEIEVTDRAHTAKGWVYLVHFADRPPAASGERYVAYDRSRNRASSSFYEVDYAPERNFFTGLHILPAAGGDGRNLLRQTRMLGRPTLRLLFTDLTLGFTEQNSIVVVDGVRTGPVRAVRRVRLSIDLGHYFPELPSGTAYTYHYRTSYLTPSRMQIPWFFLKVLRSFSFEQVAQFRPDATPVRYWDGANRDGVATTGSGERPISADVDHDWWVHSGGGGTMLHAFIVPPEWRRWGIARGTIFRNDKDGFAAGYSLLNMTRLKRGGSYKLLMADIVLPKPYAPGDEDQAMAMLRAPLRTTVRAFAAPADTVPVGDRHRLPTP
jgi:hypothetical protein